MTEVQSYLSFCSTGAGTGVPFHFHGPGFGEVIFGRKVSTCMSMTCHCLSPDFTHVHTDLEHINYDMTFCIHGNYRYG